MSFKYLLLQLVLFAAIFFLVFSQRMQKLENSDAIIAEEAEILLYDSKNLTELMKILDANDVQYNKEDMVWAAGIYERNQFLTGRYFIDGGMRFETFLGKLTRGEQDPKRIIVRPGQTYSRFFDRVPTQFKFTSAELEAAMRDTTYIREKLGLEPHLLFGRMIPNTYEMFWTITPYQFIERMLSEYERATSSLQEKAIEKGLTMDEVLTFASIVELEALYDSEKPKIAGLYWNRLNQRWRLQADPTVSYAVGERRRLFYADYRMNHPYNTYRIYGLPPGPITNPAIASIRSVLEPESHPYMFMVATPEGYHTFTRTYEEHRRESAKWRRWISEQQRIKRAREREEKRQRELMQATL